jgi:hypothetical protein
MGTSLSGLTPATTFDGLLKTSDNEPLDDSLKTIGTGDGTDSILQLSNSALSIGGETTIQIPTTGTILQVGNLSNPTQRLRIEKPYDALNLFDIKTSGGNPTRITMYDNYMRFGVGGLTTRLSLNNSGNLGLGIEDNIASARAHIKGSGTTSATTSLLVQNSAGTELFKVQDDGRVDFASLYASGDVIFGANPNFKIQIAPGINTYTTFASHRFNVYDGFGYNEAMRIVGDSAAPKVGIGETTPTARLHVKGSGNDNTTTSLLVQNSDGTDGFWAKDDGTAYVRGNFGIGTPSPGQALSVIGTQIISGRITANGGITASNAQSTFKGSGTTSATTTMLVENTSGIDLFRVRDDGSVVVRSNTGNIAGSANFVSSGNDFSLSTNYYYRFRTSGDNKIVFGTGYNGTNTYVYNENSQVVGDISAPTARLQVKGSGNDATTTALLVQNSDGDDMLKVLDDGALTITSDADFIVEKANGANNFVVEANETTLVSSNYYFLGQGLFSIQSQDLQVIWE